MKTPKYTVGQTVLFSGQNYSLHGKYRLVGVITSATYNKEVATVTYDIYIESVDETAHNCWEDMISAE